MLILKPNRKEDIVFYQDRKEIVRLRHNSGDNRALCIDADKSIEIGRVPAKKTNP